MPKGYWINHVEEIIDQDAFGRYITKWNALVDRGEAKVIVIGPVAKTQIGPVDMQFAAVVEFETFEKAMSFKTCLLYTSPSPRDLSTSRMPSSA